MIHWVLLLLLTFQSVTALISSSRRSSSPYKLRNLDVIIFGRRRHSLLFGSSVSSEDVKDLHLLTFDLDDTVFPITPVVQDANSMMIRALNSFGYEANNDEIIAASKRIRRELRERGEEITYTTLRKKSIRCEMERVCSTRNVDNAIVDMVFDSWLEERHASANRNIFPYASSALQRIRELYPSAVIGAITNGRGNPFKMPTIAQYFDFCVSGEDDNVFPLRKPDKGIYEAALRRYGELMNTSNKVKNWIHVGDDLANDVGASAACGAKTVWITTDKMNLGCETGGASWSTATSEEMQKRKEMDKVAKRFVDAKIYGLNDLEIAIEDILNNR